MKRNLTCLSALKNICCSILFHVSGLCFSFLGLAAARLVDVEGPTLVWVFNCGFEPCATGWMALASLWFVGLRSRFLVFFREPISSADARICFEAGVKLSTGSLPSTTTARWLLDDPEASRLVSSLGTTSGSISMSTIFFFFFCSGVYLFVRISLILNVFIVNYNRLFLAIVNLDVFCIFFMQFIIIQYNITFK